MKLSIKISVAFLALMLMVWGCGMSQVPDTDHPNSIKKLSPIPGSSHENSVPAEYEIIDLGTLGGNFSQAVGINETGNISEKEITVSVPHDMELG